MQHRSFKLLFFSLPRASTVIDACFPSQSSTAQNFHHEISATVAPPQATTPCKQPSACRMMLPNTKSDPLDNMLALVYFLGDQNSPIQNTGHPSRWSALLIWGSPLAVLLLGHITITINPAGSHNNILNTATTTIDGAIVYRWQPTIDNRQQRQQWLYLIVILCVHWHWGLHTKYNYLQQWNWWGQGTSSDNRQDRQINATISLHNFHVGKMNAKIMHLTTTYTCAGVGWKIPMNTEYITINPPGSA